MKTPRKPVGFISIAVGDGVASAFRDLGVDYIVPGGQTMNPSTDDILAAVDAVNADTIFVFPNNKNIFLVAERAAEMTEDKKLIVIHSSQFTQGITAMMVYDESASPEENGAAMEEAITTVTTLSFTHAVRDAEIDGLSIKDGETLGLINGKVKASSMQLLDVLGELAPTLGGASFLTVYSGADATDDEVAAVEAMLAEKLPDAEVVTIQGGQPLYPFVIAAE